jgi:hypothetical protein
MEAMGILAMSMDDNARIRLRRNPVFEWFAHRSANVCAMDYEI